MVIRKTFIAINNSKYPLDEIVDPAKIVQMHYSAESFTLTSTARSLDERKHKIDVPNIVAKTDMLLR